MKSILYVSNYPTPYRVDFFNALGEQCDLTVLFEEDSKKQTHRDSKWFKNEYSSFKCYFLKEHIIAGKQISFELISYLKKKYDMIVFCNISRINIQIAILYCQMKKIDYCIEADGGFPNYTKSFKQQYKKCLIKKAKVCFASGNVTYEYFLSAGAEKSHIVFYPFSSLRDSDIYTSVPVSAFKMKEKIALNIEEEIMVLSVGQFIPRKGFDILLKAAQNMNRKIGIYIVGAEPTDELIEYRKNNNLYNVHFDGFKVKEELNHYYDAADIFVLPTREDIWGLVINEAMAHGLPVITTDKCIAGLELVEDKQQCIVHSENDLELAEAIDTLANNKMLRNNIAEHNIMRIRKYTIEHMVEAHMDILKQCHN